MDGHGSYLVRKVCLDTVVPEFNCTLRQNTVRLVGYYGLLIGRPTVGLHLRSGRSPVGFFGIKGPKTLGSHHRRHRPRTLPVSPVSVTTSTVRTYESEGPGSPCRSLLEVEFSVPRSRSDGNRGVISTVLEIVGTCELRMSFVSPIKILGVVRQVESVCTHTGGNNRYALGTKDLGTRVRSPLNGRNYQLKPFVKPLPPPQNLSTNDYMSFTAGEGTLRYPSNGPVL